MDDVAVTSRTRSQIARDMLLALVCLGMVVASTLATWALLGIGSANHKADKANDKADVANSAAAVVRHAADQLANQVKQLGGTPVVQPSQLPGPVGPQGPTGPGPSATQVALAVASWCASRNNCTPTAAQVATAVRLYCTGGVCRGPQGKAGSSGAPGTAGPSGASGSPGATGSQGPPPSDEQVAAAVASYCSAHNGCVGPTGMQGPPGATGATGAAGEPPQSWTFKVGPFLFTCKRDVPFDPSAPTYNCQTTP